MVSASPYIEIATVSGVIPDQTVAVPVQYVSDETAVSLQFDVFFDIEQFLPVDLDECELDIDDKFWAECKRMPAPNSDVVRVSVIGDPLGGIPSGNLIVLNFKVSAQAVQKTSRLHIDKCSAFAYDSAGIPYRFFANRLIDGSIAVDSQIVDNPGPPPVYRLITEYTEADAPLPFYAKALYDVKFNQDLKFAPEQMLLDLPGKMETIVIKRRFVPKEGFLPRIGCSEQMLVDPEASPSDFQYYWYGIGENFGYVSASVYNGSISASISVQGGSFQLRGNPDDGFRLLEYDLSQLPPVHGPILIGSAYSVPSTSFITNTLLVIIAMLLGMLRIANRSYFE